MFAATYVATKWGVPLMMLSVSERVRRGNAIHGVEASYQAERRNGSSARMALAERQGANIFMGCYKCSR